MGKVVLITGISSGFGKETARVLSENGYTVYGTVRKDVTALKHVNYLKMDLTDMQSIKIATDSVVANEGRIDILINNAGMHTGGPVETTPFEYVKCQMDTNFMGMVKLTREVLPVMRKQGGGTIINLSSIGGLMGLPFQAFYSAGKFAIEGFSQALRMELKNFNIKVIVINPGDFNTNNTAARRSYLAPTGKEDPYNKQFSRSLEVIEKEEIKGGKPEMLARKMLKIIEKPNPGNRYIIASFEQKLAVYVKYLLPEKWFDRILLSHYKID
jgi:short-subunit dehydrogenase